MAFEAEFIHGTTTMVDHTPGSAVAAGTIIVVGDETRIAHADLAADELGALAAPTGDGVYRVPKATGASTAIAAGVKVYWDDTANVATEDDDTGTNKPLGWTVAASIDADTHLLVRHAA